MLVFNCSQTARKFFSRKVERKAVTFVEPAPCPDWRDDQFQTDDGKVACLEQWQVHVHHHGQRPVLLVMHMPTRYVMVFVNVFAGEPNMFLEHFLNRWLNHMLSMGQSLGLLDETDCPDVIHHCMQAHIDFRLFARTDPSVGAHIGQVIDHFEDILQEAGAFPASDREAAGFDEQANIQPRKIGKKGKNFEPFYVMFRHWWEQSGQADRMPIAEVEARIAEHRKVVLSRFGIEA